MNLDLFVAIRVIRGQILIDGGRVAHESARIDTNKEEEIVARRRGELVGGREGELRTFNIERSTLNAQPTHRFTDSP